MRLAGRTAWVAGGDGPLGAAIARALLAEGARLLTDDPGPGERALPDLGVEAGPVQAAPGDPWEAALLAAARPLARLARLVSRVAPGGAALLVVADAAPRDPWAGAARAWRAEAVAALARQQAPRRVRVNALAHLPLAAGARLPGFLARGAPAPGPAADPDEVARAATWLLAGAHATGLVLTLDDGR